MKKKLLTIFLVISLMLIAVPTGVFANVNDGTDTPAPAVENPTAPAETAPADLSDEDVQTVPEVIDLHVEDQTPTSVKLVWGAKNDTDAVVYAVYNGDTEIAADLEDTSYEIRDLSAEKEYSFTVKVKAADAEEYSGDAVVTVTTPPETKVSTASGTSIADVPGFTARATYYGVILQWIPVSGAASYFIHWEGNGCSGDVTAGPNEYSGKYMWTAPDKIYTYYIYAVAADGTRSVNPARCIGDSVRTMYYTLKFNTGRTLYSHSGGRVRAYFPRGRWFRAVGYTQGKYVFYYGGRIYHVARWSTSGAQVVQANVRRTYRRDEAEFFVNRLGLASRTKYLIWVNTYTQKLYIFKGSKGHWVSQNPGWPVSTGAPSSPTETGLARIRQKDYRNNDSNFWSVCSSYSIHSKPASQHQGLLWPYSGSCVRNTWVNARWIYYNCPIGTSVYVF